jgi:hypothetical protein
MKPRRPRISTPYRAKYLGELHGKDVYDYPVLIEQSWLDRDLHEAKTVVRVRSESARDAAALVWDEIAHLVERPTQVTVVGPSGGVAAHRFIGWESMVMAKFIQSRPAAVQPTLF